MIKEQFKQLETTQDMAKIIEDVFGVKLDISGGWGYDHKSAVVINTLENSFEQFVDMFANIRANIQMNLTLDDDNRYASINLILKNIEKKEIDNIIYDVVKFELTAMNEKTYSKFIQEYKDNYGKKEFDLESHFNKRKENTINQIVEYWFLQK